MAELTKAQKLLIAARAFDPRGLAEFSAEDLVVAAFRLFPIDFSLKGYPNFPDNNAVLTLLMGKDARLIVTGWLEKTGSKRYRLTSKGLHDADSLATGIDSEATATATVSRSDRKLDEPFGRLFDSSAFDLYRSGEAEKITFHQFCRFVGLGAPDTLQKIQGKLKETRHLVDEASKLGESGRSLRIHYRGSNHEYSAKDLMDLKLLFETIVERFKGEMAAWEKKLRTPQ
jgi:hypothetical protein